MKDNVVINGFNEGPSNFLNHCNGTDIVNYVLKRKIVKFFTNHGNIFELLDEIMIDKRWGEEAERNNKSRDRTSKESAAKGGGGSGSDFDDDDFDDDDEEPLRVILWGWRI